MNLLNALRRDGLRRFMVATLLVLPTLGCGRGQPERPEDPDEIEKLRQEHLENSRREMQEAG
jgi:hypothetical protein